jgi:hypothetical protein
MEGVERGSGWGRKDVRGINSDGEGAGGPLRWRRGVPGEGAGGEGHHAATLGGGGLRPDRWAADTSPIVVRKRTLVLRQGRVGVSDGWPRTTVKGGAVKSDSNSSSNKFKSISNRFKF